MKCPSTHRPFLAKCTLAHAISNCAVLVASEQKLLMMRPYKIYAVKNLVGCITDNCGKGYLASSLMHLPVDSQR